jgi:hypothetical protein
MGPRAESIKEKYGSLFQKNISDENLTEKSYAIAMTNSFLNYFFEELEEAALASTGPLGID